MIAFIESKKTDELFNLDREIKITVECENGSKKIIPFKRKLPLKRLMQDYCSREGHFIDKCEFSYNDQKILDTDTAESLKMNENEATIKLKFLALTKVQGKF